jgi:hypothetical protein
MSRNYNPLSEEAAYYSIDLQNSILKYANTTLVVNGDLEVIKLFP